MSVTLAEAKRVAQGAIDKAKELKIMISVCVVDSGGRLVLLHRQDGGIWAANWGCQAKARGAVALGGQIEPDAQPEPYVLEGIRALVGGHMIVNRPGGGGVPIIRSGVLVGAVGVGGGTGGEDGDCAKAGAAKIS